MTDELLCRLVAQAIQYGELMLTPAEADPFRTWLLEHPAASCVSAGRLYVFAQLPVHVLELV